MDTNYLLANLLDVSNENLAPGVITIASICALMLFANMLRRKIPFLRRSLMPTAVIAGLLGLAIKEIVRLITGTDIVTEWFFNSLTISTFIYHALPIGFIALCLREKDDYSYDFNKAEVKKERVAGFKSGSVIVSTYLMQALVGIAVTIFLAVTFMPELNKAFGLILPLGFGQGPQQASITGGTTWGNLFDAWGGKEAGQNFGITVAAFGFLWAAIPGVFMVNRIAKKKGIQLKQNEFQTSSDTPSTSVEGPDEVPLSESIDKFTLQVCMVGGVYLLTMGIIIGIEVLFRAIAGGNPDHFLIGLIPTIWGFAFMIAVAVALLTKTVLRRLVKSGVMKRKYPNSYMLNRISGAAFDISIAGALALISVEALGALWIPVLIMTALGGVASIFYLRYVCRKIYKDYPDEAFLAMYGMLTGTISNGMILLREIDNEFKTPAADDLVIGSSSAIILGFPLLLLIAQAPLKNNWWWVALVIIGYFAAITFYQFGFKKKRAAKTAAAQPPAEPTEAKTEE